MDLVWILWLNHSIKRDSYSIPTIEELLDCLKGAKYFTSLDLSFGYHQVEIEESHKEHIAFCISSIGFFEYNRMAFDLTNAPACFQRLMDLVLDGMLQKDVLMYLDDIIIMATTPEEHSRILEEVLRRMDAAGLKLKPTKCHFMKRCIAYLGHIVSENTIECDSRLTKTVQNWLAPVDQKTLMQVLSFTDFYCMFIKDYASVARPLTQLLGGLRKGKDRKTSQIWKTSFAVETKKWILILLNLIFDVILLCIMNHPLGFIPQPFEFMIHLRILCFSKIEVRFIPLSNQIENYTCEPMLTTLFESNLFHRCYKINDIYKYGFKIGPSILYIFTIYNLKPVLFLQLSRRLWTKYSFIHLILITLCLLY